MKDSEYQLKVYDFIKNDTRNGLISAVAGSGKTTTLVKALEFIPSNQSVLFSAFNKSISEELKVKIGYRPNLTIKTLHGLGYDILRKNLTFELDNYKYRSIMVDIQDSMKKKRKTPLDKYSFTPNSLTLVDEIIDLIKQHSRHEYNLQEIVSMVNLARLNYIDVHSENASKDIISLSESYETLFFHGEEKIVLNLIKLGIEFRKKIDFTDMVYLPVYFNLQGDLYDIIFIDECQDLNTTQRTLIMSHLKPNGRFIAVGDENQCIYQFAGADIESYDKLRNTPNTVELPLSICYRCDKNIVSFIKSFNNKLEWFEGNDDGEVIMNASYTDLKDGDMVLCALTLPLVVLCVKLIQDNKSAYISGSDIGANLISLINTYQDGSMRSTIKKLNNVLKEKKDFLIKTYKYTLEEVSEDSSIRVFQEKITILETLSKSTDSPEHVINSINTLFDNTKNKGIKLSTVHKAKGLENERVFIIESQLLTDNLDTVVGKNLYYVALSRAKHTLGFIKDFTIFNNGKIKSIESFDVNIIPTVDVSLDLPNRIKLKATNKRIVNTAYGARLVFDFLDNCNRKYSKFEDVTSSIQVGKTYDTEFLVNKTSEYRGITTYNISRFIFIK